MSSEKTSKAERVLVYIDGFNLYFGIKSKGWKSFYWLDIVKLSNNLLKETQQFVSVKYFTSRISFPPEKVKRQATYISNSESKLKPI